MAQPLPIPQSILDPLDPSIQGLQPESRPSLTPPASKNTPKQTSSLHTARLIRTTHTEDGTSIFSSDASVPQVSPFGPEGISFTVFDTRAAVPVNNMDPTPAFSEALPRCPSNGAVFCLADIPPGGSVPVHRTQTLDYCTVLSGEIVVGLDCGEKIARAGDFIIQQGVNHEWVNRSSDVCRVLFVMLGAEKVQLQDGNILEPTFSEQNRLINSPLSSQPTSLQ